MGSVTRRRGLSVAASPLNEVKLELAVILCLGALLLLIHPRVLDGRFSQYAVLAGYGIGASAWLVWRTRRAATRAIEQAQAADREEP